MVERFLSRQEEECLLSHLLKLHHSICLILYTSGEGSLCFVTTYIIIDVDSCNMYIHIHAYIQCVCMYACKCVHEAGA